MEIPPKSQCDCRKYGFWRAHSVRSICFLFDQDSWLVDKSEELHVKHLDFRKCLFFMNMVLSQKNTLVLTPLLESFYVRRGYLFNSMFIY